MTLNEIDLEIKTKQDVMNHIVEMDRREATKETELYKNGTYDRWCECRNTRAYYKNRLRELNKDIESLCAQRKTKRIETANDENTRLLKSLKILLKNCMKPDEYERMMRMAQEMADDSAL